MRYKRNILLFLILNIAFSSFVFAQSSGGSGGMLLLNNSPLTESLFESKGFAGLFNTLLNIIITLAAIWAVIELSYYGAKYALLDSFTGKKDAIKNIWPVVYGLIALLGIVLFFKQINPKLLQLDFSSANLQGKVNVSEKLEDVDIKNAKKQNTTTASTLNLNHITNADKLPVAQKLKNKEIQENIRNNLKENGGVNKICNNDRLCRGFIADMRRCSAGTDNTACVRVDTYLEQEKYRKIYEKLIAKQ